jgi:hypothetical protein
MLEAVLPLFSIQISSAPPRSQDSFPLLNIMKGFCKRFHMFRSIAPVDEYVCEAGIRTGDTVERGLSPTLFFEPGQ